MGDEIICIIADADRPTYDWKILASINRNDEDIGANVAYANSRLMAASPDLLAACDAAESILRYAAYTSTNCGGTKPNMDTSTALKMVRDAIAKATGTP